MLSGVRKRVLGDHSKPVAALDDLLKAGIEVPRRAGLLSTMGGCIAIDQSITSAGFDFQLMGAEAARMAVGGTLRHLKLPPAFSPGGHQLIGIHERLT